MAEPERTERRLRPAQLLFEPSETVTDPEHFFDLESIDDPRELLNRATELTLAFRAAQERAVEFQAVAAAQLADPRRFDRLPAAAIAEQAEWTEDYARKMIEFGESLLRGAAPRSLRPSGRVGRRAARRGSRRAHAHEGAERPSPALAVRQHGARSTEHQSITARHPRQPRSRAPRTRPLAYAARNIPQSDPIRPRFP